MGASTVLYRESSKAGRRKSPCCQYAARARARRQLSLCWVVTRGSGLERGERRLKYIYTYVYFVGRTCRDDISIAALQNFFDIFTEHFRNSREIGEGKDSIVALCFPSSLC